MGIEDDISAPTPPPTLQQRLVPTEALLERALLKVYWLPADTPEAIAARQSALEDIYQAIRHLELLR